MQILYNLMYGTSQTLAFGMRMAAHQEPFYYHLLTLFQAHVAS